MESNPKKRPNIRYINALITTWIEEMENPDDENEIKKQFLEASKTNKTKPNIESSKSPNHNDKYISKPINIQEISNRLKFEIPNDL